MNLLAATLFYLLCLINGGTSDELVSVAVGPTMRTDEYLTLKKEMGHYDMEAHEFLKVLKAYCPDQLHGIESIQFDDDLPVTSELVTAERAEQRAEYTAAWEEAQVEYNEWLESQSRAQAQTRYGDYVYDARRPTGGIGILFHDNNWRQDDSGAWRSQSGNYAPWNVNHDPYEHYGRTGMAWTLDTPGQARDASIRAYKTIRQDVEERVIFEPTPETITIPASENILPEPETEEGGGGGRWRLMAFCVVAFIGFWIIAAIFAVVKSWREGTRAIPRNFGSKIKSAFPHREPAEGAS